MKTTGPILLTGAVTFVNKTIFAGQPVDWSIPIYTGVAAAIGALAETAFGDAAVAVAWLAVAAVLLSTPSIGNPVVNAQRFLSNGGQ